MTRRLIRSVSGVNSGLTAKVYRDATYDEYIVTLYAHGVKQVDADYNTDDRTDAMSTAAAMVKGANQ